MIQKFIIELEHVADFDITVDSLLDFIDWHEIFDVEGVSIQALVDLGRRKVTTRRHREDLTELLRQINATTVKVVDLETSVLALVDEVEAINAALVDPPMDPPTTAGGHSMTHHKCRECATLVPLDERYCAQCATRLLATEDSELANAYNAAHREENS
jgi:hypothetical protein